MSPDFVIWVLEIVMPLLVMYTALCPLVELDMDVPDRLVSVDVAV